MHSQRLSAKPLKPWILAEKGGRILAAHCDCMAGLGEICTHVAALLFAIEATVKVRDSKTVTEEKAYWLLPAGVSGATYREVSDIDFTSAKTKKKLLDLSISSCSSPPIPARSASKASSVPVATQQDMLAFCEQLHQTGKRVGILSCMSSFSDDYVPSSLNDNFPTPLTELLDDKCYDLNYAELVSVCESLHVSVSEKEAEAVEAATREQAMSKLWFRFRAGRITASKSKSVCHTNPAQPAISLIRGICNPEGSTFSTKATRWGCEHEEVARDKFIEEISKMHVNFKVSECGFFINPDVPYLGASPDGLVWCDCCGEGCLEIKCPFCKKDQTLSDTESDNKFCLQKDDDGRLRLTDKHAYYYQVQHQLGVCRREFCYFVVWTEHDVHIEIITFDSELWEQICEKSLHIFQAAILPELVAKFFTRLPNTTVQPACTVSANSSSLASGDSEPLFCYCEQVESGDMVCCDNDSCEIKWFHYECVKISRAPRTKKWYCPDCRKLPQFKRGRKAIPK